MSDKWISYDDYEKLKPFLQEDLAQALEQHVIQKQDYVCSEYSIKPKEKVRVVKVIMQTNTDSGPCIVDLVREDNGEQLFAYAVRGKGETVHVDVDLILDMPVRVRVRGVSFVQHPVTVLLEGYEYLTKDDFAAGRGLPHSIIRP